MIREFLSQTMRYGLSQAFLLPTGPYFVSRTEPKVPDELEPWRKKIDQLAEGKLSWDQFFALLGKGALAHDHPALNLSSSRGGNNLLHLAIYQDQRRYLQALNLPMLKLRRNSYGLTPLELARCLNHPSWLSLLQAAPAPTFWDAKHLTIEDPEAFKTSVSASHLPYLTYESPEILDLILYKTKKAKLNDSIPSDKIWMGVYFDKEMQEHLHPKVSIRWVSQSIGFGAFAAQRIPPCAFVGEYTGIVRERKKKIVKDNDYCVRYTTWEIGRKGFVIDAKEQGNFTRFINHSSRPNVGLQSIHWRGLPRMIFISLREIAEGEQLTFDYGLLFWKESDKIPQHLK